MQWLACVKYSMSDVGNSDFSCVLDFKPGHNFSVSHITLCLSQTSWQNLYLINNSININIPQKMASAYQI